jgi:hypothetical protein
MKHLRRRGIEHDVKDIDSDPGAERFVRVRQGGKRIAPMLWDHERSKHIVGYQPDLIDRFLEGVG